jgi:GNAT superfamily N-acetyltransferase
MAAMNVDVRLAKESDFSAVWEMSDGMYAGLDVLPKSFLNMLDDPRHTVLVAVKDGKAVGLRVILIIEDGETAIFQGLRVHIDYQGRGIAKELMKASEEHLRQHYPRVNTIRYSVTDRSKSRLALQMRCDDRVLYKLALCACLVDPNTTPSLLQRYSEGTTSTGVKEVNINEINIFLKQNKLDHILFNNSFCMNYDSFRATQSNIDDGFIDDKHNFFASSHDNIVESLSQSKRSSAVKWPRWAVTLYPMDENLLENHLVKHIEKAIQQDSETFALICFFQVPLLKRISKFLFHNLALENIDEYCSEGHLLLSIFEKDFSKQTS